MAYMPLLGLEINTYGIGSTGGVIDVFHYTLWPLAGGNLVFDEFLLLEVPH
jgi:hypothetical protein